MEPAWDSLSPSLCLLPASALSLKINKHPKKKKDRRHSCPHFIDGDMLHNQVGSLVTLLMSEQSKIGWGCRISMMSRRANGEGAPRQGTRVTVSWGRQGMQRAGFFSHTPSSPQSLVFPAHFQGLCDSPRPKLLVCQILSALDLQFLL